MGEEQKFKGVWRASDTSIGIRFRLNGKWVREFIPARPTVEAMRSWSNKREVMIEEIKQQRFDYARWFPWSKKATARGSLLVSALLESWIVGQDKVLERTTLRKVVSIVNNVLIPAFGHLSATEFHAGHLQDLIDSKEWTRKTTSNNVWPLRQAFVRAVHIDRVLDVDPLANYKVRRRRIDRERPPAVADPFNDREYRALLDAAQPDLALYIQFAVWTGLRPEEMIELHWADVDFVNGLVRVSRARVGNIVKGTKTRSSDRDVTLLPEAIAALQQAKASSWLAGDHVFLCKRTGKRWSGDAVRYAMERACKRAGVRYRPPSQLRHTYASRMLTSGEDLAAIAGQMGHKDLIVTGQIYAKLIEELTVRKFGAKASKAYSTPPKVAGI